MVVILSPGNKLIWSVTSQMIRTNWSVLSNYVKGPLFGTPPHDFGIGSEPTYRCVSCRRYCPVATSTVDHIVPRSLMKVHVFDIPGRDHCFLLNTFWMNKSGMISVIPNDLGKPLRLHYTIERIGTSDFMRCHKEFSSEVLFTWNVYDVAVNMLNNLQPMCAYCNSCKGNRS